MNLTKLFCKNYAKQNIKKSKSVLITMLFIIPVINLLVLYNYNKESFYNHPFDISALNIVNFLGMYIIPVVVSIVLLGYVYKKNSIDFVHSMPLNRRQIYITNIILGAIYLIALQLFNFIVLGIYILVVKNNFLSFSMIIDSFFIMSIGYIFVYILSCLALSVSGNKMIQIVLIAIILFLIPFTRIVTFGDVFQKKISYKFLDGEEMVVNENIYPYELSFTQPIEIPILLAEGNSLINVKSIILTIVVGILYLGIGTYLFEKRKMENTESSFFSTKIHIFVKLLTLYPLITFYNKLFELSDGIETILMILLLLIYYFIYDLITAKKVKIRVNVATFVVFGLLILGTVNIIDYMQIDVKHEQIDFNNVKAISIYDYDVFIEDEEAIKLLLNNLKMDKSLENDMYININLKQKNNRVSNISGSINVDILDKVLEKVVNNEEYINKIIENNKIKGKIFYGINLDSSYNVNNKNLVDKELEDALNNKEFMKEFYKNQIKGHIYWNSNNVNNSLFMQLYEYKNHQYKHTTVYINKKDFKDLYDLIITKQNKSNYETILSRKNNYISGIVKNIDNKKLMVNLNYDTNGYKLLIQKIIEFMKDNYENKFDSSLPFYEIKISNLYFYTNEIEKIQDLIGNNIKFEQDNYNDYEIDENNAIVNNQIENKISTNEINNEQNEVVISN